MNASSEEYYYDPDYVDEVCDKAGVVKFGSIVIPVFFSVVIALSLLGNILVLVILALYENLKSLTNVFTLNLAISDLVFTAGLPFWAVYHVWGWVLGNTLCKIVVFVFFTGFYSSVLFLTTMTVHRYLAVVHSLSGHGVRVSGYGVAASITLWAVSVLAAVPSLVFSSVIAIHHKDGDSWGCEYEDPLWKTVGTYQQNVLFLVAFAVIGFCYVRILGKIVRTRSHMKNRTVKLIFSLVTVFFLGWIPYNVVIFLRTLADYPVPPFNECEVSMRLDYGFYVCRLIAFSHCCLNPIFYAFVGVRFRSHLKAILRKMLNRQNPVDLQQVRMASIHSNGLMY